MPVFDRIIDVSGQKENHFIIKTKLGINSVGRFKFGIHQYTPPFLWANKQVSIWIPCRK